MGFLSNSIWDPECCLRPDNIFLLLTLQGSEINCNIIAMLQSNNISEKTPRELSIGCKNNSKRTERKPLRDPGDLSLVVSTKKVRPSGLDYLSNLFTLTKRICLNSTK